jgi:hypothetical protein
VGQQFYLFLGGREAMNSTVPVGRLLSIPKFLQRLSADKPQVPLENTQNPDHYFGLNPNIMFVFVILAQQSASSHREIRNITIILKQTTQGVRARWLSRFGRHCAAHSDSEPSGAHPRRLVNFRRPRTASIPSAGGSLRQAQSSLPPKTTRLQSAMLEIIFDVKSHCPRLCKVGNRLRRTIATIRRNNPLHIANIARV